MKFKSSIGLIFQSFVKVFCQNEMQLLKCIFLLLNFMDLITKVHQLNSNISLLFQHSQFFKANIGLACSEHIDQV